MREDKPSQNEKHQLPNKRRLLRDKLIICFTTNSSEVMATFDALESIEQESRKCDDQHLFYIYFIF